MRTDAGQDALRNLIREHQPAPSWRRLFHILRLTKGGQVWGSDPLHRLQ